MAVSTDRLLIQRYTIEIPRGATRSYRMRLTDQDGEPIALTNVELRAAVWDKTAGAFVIQKTSNDPGHIDPDPDQVLNKGWATVTCYGSETEGLDPTHAFTWELWALITDGRRDALIDTSPFRLRERYVDLSDPPAPPLSPTDPAPQTEQEQSFTVTLAGAGTSHAITIPSSLQMLDVDYIAIGAINTPVGGATAILWVEDASKSVTGFTLSCSASLPAGTTVDFLLRDRA